MSVNTPKEAHTPSCQARGDAVEGTHFLASSPFPANSRASSVPSAERPGCWAWRGMGRASPAGRKVRLIVEDPGKGLNVSIVAMFLLLGDPWVPGGSSLCEWPWEDSQEKGEDRLQSTRPQT